MRAAFIAIVAFVLTACATQAPPPDRYGGMRLPRMSNDELSDLLPRANWWHEPRINERLDLSGEQMQKLDALQNERTEEITRLQNDLRLVMRDLRSTLERRDANELEILAAGDRLAQLRDDLFRKQLAMLAAERAILTQTQWAQLQQQLEEREERRMGPPGGRGGFGGRRPRM